MLSLESGGRDVVAVCGPPGQQSQHLEAAAPEGACRPEAAALQGRGFFEDAAVGEARGAGGAGAWQVGQPWGSGRDTVMGNPLASQWLALLLS